MRYGYIFLMSVLVLVLMLPKSATAAEFYELDEIIDPNVRSIEGLSYDGSVITGSVHIKPHIFDPEHGWLAYRWDQETQQATLLPKPPVEVIANDLADAIKNVFRWAAYGSELSDDGNVVLYSAEVAFDINPRGRASVQGAFRWTEQLGAVPLGALPGHNSSTPRAMSEDGNVVVGQSFFVNLAALDSQWATVEDVRPFIWTMEDGMQEFSPPDGFSKITPFNLSRDGKVVVGGMYDTDQNVYSFRWTAETGPVLLDGSPSEYHYAVDVSHDGNSIIGWIELSKDRTGPAWSNGHAYRWTPESGMTDLGVLPGGEGSKANSITADGAIVVGESLGKALDDDAWYRRAFVWDDSHGMQDLQDVLIRDHGLGDHLADWELTYVDEISANGQVLRGSGDYEGRETNWIVFLDSPVVVVPVLGDFDRDGLLTVADIDRLVPGSTDLQFDLDANGVVDLADRTVWVKSLVQTWYGDANLDGEFNTGDLVQVLETGKYETQQYASWSEGDWNGDGVFGTGDLVIALEDGGYEQGPRTDAMAVPEPAGWLLLLMGLLPSLHRRPARSAV